MTSQLRFINPDTIAQPVGYTHIVEARSGITIYISGQVAMDTSRNLVGDGDMRAQAQQVFINLKAALEAVGADFRSVVKFTFFMTDISQIQAVRDIRDQFIDTANPPASTAVEVRALFREGYMIEIEAIAVIPE